MSFILRRSALSPFSKGAARKLQVAPHNHGPVSRLLAEAGPFYYGVWNYMSMAGFMKYTFF